MVTNERIDVVQARALAEKAGWGRIHVTVMPAEHARYLAKYLSKERPPCLKRWRLWAAFGEGWEPTKVKDLIKESLFSTVYRACKEWQGWIGRGDFFERLDFVRSEFRRAGQRADDAAARALLDAVGADLRELAAACEQLAADSGGQVDEAVVATYYRGRAEATGFTVADRAVEGHLVQSLEQLRWALGTGVSPVLICSALAQGVRLLGRVGSAPRGVNSMALAAEVGAPPWKIDRVRQQLRGWQPQGIARALHAVAEADAQVKGEASSAGYALERAVRRIVASRAGEEGY